MTPALLSLGTALPPHVLEQTDALTLYRTQPGTDRLNARLLSTVFGASGVERRHTVLAELVDDDARTDSPYVTAEGAFREPLTGARNRTYTERAPALFAEAARDALDRCPQVDPASVTDVVTVSCTGFFAPGPDYRLVRDLGLDPSVRRSHIGFMGCHGGLIGLRQAASIATADPEAVVLVVAVELCSLHLRPARDPDAIRGAALFADGGAAALVSSRVPAGATALLELDRFSTLVIPDGEHAMAWTIGDTGFEMILGAAVPHVLEENIHAALQALLDGPGPPVAREAVTDWALHPGGRGILDKLEQTLGLGPDALRESRDVLAQRGNMSSVTVLHVLRQVLDRIPAGEARTVCALAFGPGLTVESALFTVPVREAGTAPTA
ncbi:type III polyketide synthase [Kocuria sp. M1R5S2]|uniref:type III polyketide synthase n=1 Tax=Kocuria rhizosphaerae TaxID=3376285 RepID=UPI0037BAE15F